MMKQDPDNLSPEELNELFDGKNRPVINEGLTEYGNRYHHFDFNQEKGSEKFDNLLVEIITYISESVDEQQSKDQLYGQFIWMEASHYVDDEETMISSKAAYELADLLKSYDADFDVEAAIDFANLVSRHYW